MWSGVPCRPPPGGKRGDLDQASLSAEVTAGRGARARMGLPSCGALPPMTPGQTQADLSHFPTRHGKPDEYKAFLVSVARDASPARKCAGRHIARCCGRPVSGTTRSNSAVLLSGRSATHQVYPEEVYRRIWISLIRRQCQCELATARPERRT